MSYGRRARWGGSDLQTSEKESDWELEQSLLYKTTKWQNQADYFEVNY